MNIRKALGFAGAFLLSLMCIKGEYYIIAVCFAICLICGSSMRSDNGTLNVVAIANS